MSDSNGMEYLNRDQIDVMITSCLKKLLEKIDGVQFLEMKDYIIGVIFK